MEARVNITLDVTDIWGDLTPTERDKFIKEIISDIDSDIMIEELETRGFEIRES